MTSKLLKITITSLYTIVLLSLLPFNVQADNNRHNNSIVSLFNTKLAKNYINNYKELAVEEMSRTGIPASIKLAQGMFESNFGRSPLAKKGNNHFGIKCKSSWDGPKVYYTDDAPNECFRQYTDVTASYIDHSKVLSGERYEKLFQLSPYDYKAWAKELKAAGYATDPLYAEKIIQVVSYHKLHRFDRATPQNTSRKLAQKSNIKSLKMTTRDEMPLTSPAPKDFSSNKKNIKTGGISHINKVREVRPTLAIEATPAAEPAITYTTETTVQTVVVQTPVPTIALPSRQEVQPQQPAVAPDMIRLDAKETNDIFGTETDLLNPVQDEQATQNTKDDFLQVKNKHHQTAAQEMPLLENINQQEVIENGKYTKTTTPKGNVFFKTNKRKTDSKKPVNSSAAPKQQSNIAISVYSNQHRDFKVILASWEGENGLSDGDGNGTRSDEEQFKEPLKLIESYENNKTKAISYNKEVSVNQVHKAYNLSIMTVMDFNDLDSPNAIFPAYSHIYLEEKKSKAVTTKKEHIIVENQTMWEIAQMYGIKLEKLLERNRMRKDEEAKNQEVILLKGKADYPPKIRINIPKSDAPKSKSKHNYKYHRERGNPLGTSWTMNTQKTYNSAVNDKDKEKKAKNKVKRQSKKTKELSLELPFSKKPKALKTNKLAKTVSSKTLANKLAKTVSSSKTLAKKTRTAKAKAPKKYQKRKAKNKVKKTTTKRPRLHLVGKKQSLFSIAKKYNVNILELAKLNDIHTGNIKVGASLYIPQ